MIHRHLAAALLVGTCASGCASSLEQQHARAVQEAERDLAPLATLDSEAEATPQTTVLDGTLPAYLAYAYAHNPALRASFEEWRASTHVAPQVRRLPEPQLTFAGFVRPVETRVGPQRAKLGLMQWFPWPSRLTAASAAADQAALASQRRFEAHATDIAAQVARVYWALWEVEHTRHIRESEREILTSFAEMVRYRMEVGGAALSDLAQVNLDVTTIQDELVALDERQRTLSAAMVRLIGAPPDTAVPVDASTPVTVAAKPKESEATLRAAAAQHPRVATMAAMTRAQEEKARAARGQRGPSMGVGVDWVITGPAVDPNMPDSGKDPVIVMGALKVPIWVGAYRAAERQAQSQAAAFRARKAAAEQRASAELTQTLVALDDTARRVDLHAKTLIPQAETAYESALGGYQSGRTTLAAVLMAERALIHHRMTVFAMQAKHAVAWSELERIVGRPVAHSNTAEKTDD